MTIRVSSLYALQLKERKKEKTEEKKKKKQTFSALLILHRLFEFLTLKSLLMFALWKQTNRQ